MIFKAAARTPGPSAPCTAAVAPESAAAFSSQLRHIAATLDVHAGEAPPRTELVPLDDDSGDGKKWAAVIAVAAIALLLWWMLK